MALKEEAVDDLRKIIRGEVLAPSAPDYHVHRRVFNAREIRRPRLIVRCAGAADVRSSILFAREHGLHVSAKGGGHGPTGFAVHDDGLLLDLSLMRAVLVDPAARTAVVQGGALWRDVYREAAAFDLLPIGGDCDMVGVGGLTLGGGWSYVSRRFGLAIDNLDSVQLVTADGELRTASEAENPDLFWALRGGGGGNFGIATSFQYRLHPLPKVFYAYLSWPIAQAHEVFALYRDALVASPPELYLDVALYHGADDTGKPRQEVGITAIFLGPDREARRLLAPFIAIAECKQVKDSGMRTFRSVLDGYAAEIVEGHLELWKARYLDAPLKEPTIDTIVEWFQRSPSTSSMFFIETLGGEIARVRPEESAYPHRDQMMCATIIGIWDETSEGPANEQWARGFARALEPAGSGAAYVNYPDADLADWPKAYYGDNYSRLVDVKKRYDPENFFRFAQSIRP